MILPNVCLLPTLRQSLFVTRSVSNVWWLLLLAIPQNSIIFVQSPIKVGRTSEPSTAPMSKVKEKPFYLTGATVETLPETRRRKEVASVGRRLWRLSC